MKKNLITHAFSLLTFFALAGQAGAQTTPATGSRTIQNLVTDYIIHFSNLFIIFLVSLTVVVFMYGLTRYMFKGSSSDAARAEGRQLMLWGLIGIFVMVSVWALVGILGSTIGHNSNVIPQFKSSGN